MQPSSVGPLRSPYTTIRGWAFALTPLGLLIACSAQPQTNNASSDHSPGSGFALTLSTGTLQLNVGEAVQLQAAPTDGNGLPYTGVFTMAWASSSTAVAQITGTGLLTAVSNGSATITATAQRVDTGATAQATVSVQVGGSSSGATSSSSLAASSSVGGSSSLATGSSSVALGSSSVGSSSVGRSSSQGTSSSAGSSGGSGGPCVITQSYFTSFDVAQDPLSEGGCFTHAPNAWQHVRTVGGAALAAAYTEVFDDAYAILGGFAGGDNYEVTATVYRPSWEAGETEILLRASDSANAVQTYEFLYNTAGSWEIVRWNGALGDYRELVGGGVPGIAGDGNQIRARIEGSVIRLFWRESDQAAWAPLNGDAGTVDTALPHGKPGMSFYVHASDQNIGVVGFRDWSVVALP